MTRHDLRKARIAVLSFSLWRKRLVFWCGAIVVGLVAAGFAWLADYMQKIFGGIVRANIYLPLALSPIVFALTAWLTARFCPGSVGSGIPQAIAARVVQDEASQRYLLGPVIIVGKILLTALAFLGGASIGREGPTVQAGAAILRLSAVIGGMSHSMQRAVILAGAAAGVAAAFNTPLAGIVFAIEEMARAFEHRDSGIVLTAIVLAGAASLSILGNYSYFGYASADLSLQHDWSAILVLGVGGGALGSLFARILTGAGPYLRMLCQHRRLLRQPAVFAFFCGLAIALLGLATHGATYGTGYAQTKSLLDGTGGGSWTYATGKFLATAISGIAGIPGGIFSPSISIGAALGASIAPWFHGITPLQGVVLLGMTGYFAGVTQAPITAFVIVLEITGRAASPVPLIAVAVIAAAIGRILCPVSLYHALARSFLVETRQIAGSSVESGETAIASIANAPYMSTQADG